VKDLNRLSANNLADAITPALACLFSYWIMTSVLNPFVARDDDLLGGMWAAVASAFVVRDTSRASFSAAVARLIATFLSFSLCLIYLLLARPTPLGMALLLAAGTLILLLFHFRNEITTTAITTVVVMVVAILNPSDALSQPLLRLLDTAVGVAVGVASSSAAVFLFRRAEHGA
jgi:uncharacterized membrane protein YccC